MLAIGLPHVDAWNVWWSIYGNTPGGFATVRSDVDAACRAVGRSADEVEATAAVYVQLGDGTGRSFGASGPTHAEPVRGDAGAIAEQLGAFASAGARHVMLVVDPITEASIDFLGGVLAILDRSQ